MNMYFIFSLIAVFFMVYPFALYPLILKVLMVFRKGRLHSLDKPRVKQEDLPSIAVLISAYNEADYIEDAIHTIIDQQYSNIEIHIGSDGSTDDTVLKVQSLQKEISQLHVHDLSKRGKNAVNEFLVAHSTSDIIVHLDADVRLKPGALYSMCARFHDTEVGAVIGTSIDAPLQSAHHDHEEEHSAYRNMEFKTRSMESALASTVTSLGHFYAVRRAYRKALPNEKVCDDYMPILQVLMEKKRVIADPHACAYEVREMKPGTEFKQAKRFAACGMATVWEAKRLLLPSFGLNTLFLWSRKMLRWLMPIIYVKAMAFSYLAWMGDSIGGEYLFYILSGIIVLSLPGFLGITIMPIRQACIFVRLQLSLLGAWVHVLSSNASSSWERS
jgi:cellulose synthase/poly-beta-1,6-N-acetylglucosamine synthase-like glycosyltransferase